MLSADEMISARRRAWGLRWGNKATMAANGGCAMGFNVTSGSGGFKCGGGHKTGSSFDFCAFSAPAIGTHVEQLPGNDFAVTATLRSARYA